MDLYFFSNHCLSTGTKIYILCNVFSWLKLAKKKSVSSAQLSPACSVFCLRSQLQLASGLEDFTSLKAPLCSYLRGTLEFNRYRRLPLLQAASWMPGLNDFISIFVQSRRLDWKKWSDFRHAWTRMPGLNYRSYWITPYSWKCRMLVSLVDYYWAWFLAHFNEQSKYGGSGLLKK